jgi:hypothetical protein
LTQTGITEICPPSVTGATNSDGLRLYESEVVM